VRQHNITITNTIESLISDTLLYVMANVGVCHASGFETCGGTGCFFEGGTAQCCLVAPSYVDFSGKSWESRFPDLLERYYDTVGKFPWSGFGFACGSGAAVRAALDGRERLALGERVGPSASVGSAECVGGRACDGSGVDVSGGAGCSGQASDSRGLRVDCDTPVAELGNAESGYVGAAGVSLAEELKSVDAVVDLKANAGSVRSKGQKKRDQLRRQRDRRRVFGTDEVVSDESVVQGRCETVVSSAPVVVSESVEAKKSTEAVPVWRRKQGSGSSSVGQRVSGSASVAKEAGIGDSLREAEKLARESLARRRAAENAVAVRMAELKLRSLNDEKKCQDYEDLKRQRIIQWQNQALAKSQSSAKSLDPDSSVSMREFRELGKKVADLEYEKKVYMDVIRKKCGDRALLDAVNVAAPMGSETEAEMQMAAEDCVDLDGDIPWIRENRVAC